MRSHQHVHSRQGREVPKIVGLLLARECHIRCCDFSGSLEGRVAAAFTPSHCAAAIALDKYLTFHQCTPDNALLMFL